MTGKTHVLQKRAGSSSSGLPTMNKPLQIEDNEHEKENVIVEHSICEPLLDIGSEVTIPSNSSTAVVTDCVTTMETDDDNQSIIHIVENKTGKDRYRILLNNGTPAANDANDTRLPSSDTID